MSLTGSAESNLLLRGKLAKIPSVDTTLTKEGECAEAKATGDAIENARELANKAQTTANSALSQVNTHTADKNNPHGVTAAQAGALASNGSIPLSGHLLMKQMENNGYGTIFKAHGTEGDWGTSVEDYDADGNKANLVVRAKDQTVTVAFNGQACRLLHTGNFSDYAVNKAGDKMTGDLTFKKAENGYGRVMKNHSDTADYGTVLSDFSKSGKEISVTLDAEHNNFLYNADGVANHILHTGNKPSGSYTGNGDATARTINTGGIGNACAVYSADGFVGLLMPQGAICRENGSIVFTTELAVHDGIIVVANSTVGNASGTMYFYQVL